MIMSPDSLKADAVHPKENTYRKGGLAHSLHGSIYQLKLQMLFLKRALDKGYEFKLGTEVEDAEKFDDIVFKYKTIDGSGEDKICFVQAKHKLDESKQITANDLLKSKDDDFSLQKYFISYRRIKNNHLFSGCKLREFIIYTNIDFADLKNASIELEYIEENDILKVTKSGKDSACWKLNIPKEHKLFEKLKDTSDLHVLVNTLKQHILEHKPLQLREPIFKIYHGPLCKKIFDISLKRAKDDKGRKVKKKYANFSANFLNGSNLPEDISNFRNVLQSALKLKDDDQYWKDLYLRTFNVSEDFGHVLEIQNHPNITDSNNLAECFAQFIIDAQKNKKCIITIKCQSNVIISNIDKLAFHIFVKDEAQKNVVRFRKGFFDDNQKLQGNLEEFRTALKTVLKKHDIDFGKLSQYKYKINKFNVCEETPEGELLYPKNELPNDVIDDSDVEDFLKDLVFAVNQPNELQLSEIITRELGESNKFNLLDANLVSDSFQRQMLDWFKEKRTEKGKEGVWLNAVSGKQFFDSIENNVSGLISIGISLAYPEKLATYGIRFGINNVFGKLKDFLSKGAECKILHIIATDETILSAINVYSALEVLKQQDEFAQYTKNDSYIFMCLSTLLRSKTQNYVINVFESKDNCNLLILDCKPAARKRDIEILYKKLENILMKTCKKVILIAKEHEIRNELFGKVLQSHFKDNTGFIDLTEESQNKLLEKEVKFQKQNINFKELIDKSAEKVDEIIDRGVMVKLIKGHEILIRSKEKDLGDINDYYIDRRFVQEVKFSKEKIEKYLNRSKRRSDLFVISGTDFSLQQNNIVFDKTDSAEHRFNELCDQHRESNIHWLKSDSKYLTWYKSHGSISNLVRYRKRDKIYGTNCSTKPPCLIEEVKLLDDSSHYKIVIISDTAGMGKSTVLAHLSMELKRNSRNLWITTINLNDYTGVFETLLSGKIKFCDQNLNEVAEFFSNNLLASHEQLMLEKNLFKNSFTNPEKLVFLFDGFDEISPDYKDIVIDLLKTLKKYKIGKLIITTRPNMSDELERALEVFSHVLEPLSKEEQIEYLTKFWNKKLNLDNLDEKYTIRLKKYVDSMIKHISKSIDNTKQAFIGIPLQTMMIAEVFLENSEESSEWQSCKAFLQSEVDQPKLPNDLAFLDLYKHFVQRKFYEFYLTEKKGRDFTKVGEKESANKEYKKFRKKHKLLAMQTLFCRKELEELLFPGEIQELERVIENIKKCKHNEGFIDKIVDDKPYFTHPTFAEYFISFPIAKKILTAPAKTLLCLNRVLINISPIFIYSLIQNLDGKHAIITALLEKPLLWFVVIEKHLNFIKCLLESDCNDWPKKLDCFGKTPLHYAMQQHGHFDMVNTLLDYVNDIYEKDILRHGSFVNPEYENSRLVKFINIQDKDGKTGIYYAIQQNRLDLAFELLLRGASIDSLTDDDVNKLISEMLYDEKDELPNRGIIGAYAQQECKYRPVQEKLLLRYPFIFSELDIYYQCRILSYFFHNGRLEVIKALLGTIDNLEKRKEILNNGDNDIAPLDRINGNNQLSDDDRLETIKYLCEQGATKIKCDEFNYSAYFHCASLDNYIAQILVAAAKSGCIETFKYFIRLEKHEHYPYHFYVACMYNQLNIIKYLFENHKEDIDLEGNTALHAACFNKVSLKTIKYLINNSDINAMNKKGATPLFSAIHGCRELDVIEYLVLKGAKINWEDQDGKTPLYYALESDQKDIINYLLENGAKISENSSPLMKDKVKFFKNPKYNLDDDENGNPNLHTAVQSKNIDKVRFLVRQGANINQLDKQGNTPFYYAATSNQVAVVELLLQYGALFDKTPIYLNYKSVVNEKISWLLKLLNKLFSSQKLMETLNQELLEKSGSSLKDWGPYGRGHPDAWDGDNPMLFIVNARNTQGKTLLHIASDTNDEQAMNVLFKFNCDYLERKLEQIICPRYQDYQPTSVDIQDSEGNTPLHLAAQKRHYRIACWLLRKGAIFNCENLQGETPEKLAINNGHDKIMDILQSIKNVFIAIDKNHNNTLEVANFIKKLAYINVKNQYGETLLHLAVSLDQPVVIQLLLDKGANIESIDLDKNTPLHIASKNNAIENIKLLLKHGAMYNAKNKQDLRPLDLAHGGSRNILEQIDKLFKHIRGDEPHIDLHSLEKLQKKYDLDIKTIINVCDSEANTLLHFAAKSGELNIVALLLKNSAYFNAVNRWRDTPGTLEQNTSTLLRSIKNMFEDVRNIYQEQKSVDIEIIKNVLDNEGKSLLYMAASSCEWEIVQYLVEQGANVNLKDIDYSTAFEYCYDRDQLKIIEYLIDNDDINAVNHKGETPLFKAILSHCQLDVIKYLVTRGSNINWEDLCGNTPLSLAVESKQNDVIKYLLEKKACLSEKSSQSIRDKVASFYRLNECN